MYCSIRILYKINLVPTLHQPTDFNTVVISTMPNFDTIVILGVVELLMFLDGGRNSIEEMGDCRGHGIGKRGNLAVVAFKF